MFVVNLPTPEGRTAEYRLKEPRAWNGNGARKFDRIAVAVAHIVADPSKAVELRLTLGGSCGA
jgi:uncharacterized protein DUF993